MNVEQIFRKKFYSIESSKTVKDAISLMEEKGISALPVLNNKGKVLGIVTLQDIAGAIVPDEFEKNPSMSLAMDKPDFFDEMCKKVGQQKVEKIMRKDFLKVKLDSPIMTVFADFLHNDLYHVPVTDENDRLLGIIARNDVKKVLLSKM